MSNADKRMDEIIKSFLLIFLGAIMAGLITAWLVAFDELSSLLTVPELLLGSFLFALLTALSIGVFFHSTD